MRPGNCMEKNRRGCRDARVPCQAAGSISLGDGVSQRNGMSWGAQCPPAQQSAACLSSPHPCQQHHTPLAASALVPLVHGREIKTSFLIPAGHC